MEIVINKCYGGFSVSQKVLDYLKIENNFGFLNNENFGIKSKNSDEYRTDKRLIESIKLYGEEANGSCSELRIIEIPDNIEWEIEEYDGIEHIAEKHRTWG